MREILAVLLIVTGLSACTDTAPRGGGDILVLGDSIMAWNGGRSIPDVIANQTGRSVTSRAVPGAQFDNGSTIASAVGFDIQQQFPGGRWNWVVVNGGANDLSADCGCGACGASVNALIAPDGQSGSIPAFLQRLRAQTGAKIMWMGYYAGSGSGSFAGCRDDLVEIESRIATFAAGRPGIHFIDSEDVIDRGDRGLFAGDNVHPSARGSARIGAYLAQKITARENRSQKPADGL
ncbi:MAG TPA: SGNH/GDSL hydrolase family protein [Sulfitobacter sp.]|uniref:SGNH/GDSL hydrolase family protein n=1 Tax=Sulfitobacter sp. TaxID=1903071 RepID=UPI000ED108CF|nr:SGNH/GDSL hydrolase family protein [Sulfitobacter sp.]HCQ59133.1 SGNH/GDSL hydrolase family protein [Sulfitobacter sp.]|tara:strand:- start:1442 stop:2146 length:705 start_codon:yes stop_codon:yes gene_type:complete